MSIGKLLTERLRLLATEGQGSAGLLRDEDGTCSIAVGEEPWRASLTIADHDRYSVTLRSLEIGTGVSAGDDTRAYLSARAAAIARQLRFLEEPLAVWELEGREALAQLRSSPPLREGEEIQYWEVILRAGATPGASIARYRWAPGMAERERISYPATFALVARMADSLAEALRDENV